MQDPPPWALSPLDALARVAGVFTDIDDTLTTEGRLSREARAGLDALHGARVPVIAITGRPLGWSERFLSEAPLAAIVAENGGVALLPGGAVEYAQDAPTRGRNAARLKAVAQRLLREVPGAALARDSAGRMTDIAIDHSEFAHLPPDRVARVVALMRQEGMHATVSSIHVNGWYGTHDKLSGARWMTERLLGRTLDAERERWVYVGDSTNDQQMFGYFPLSAGVANLRRFAGELSVWPAYLTEGERGAGFLEVAQRILAARG